MKKNGFSIIRFNKKIINNIIDVKLNDLIKIEMNNGSLLAKIKEIHEKK